MSSESYVVNGMSTAAKLVVGFILAGLVVNYYRDCGNETTTAAAIEKAEKTAAAHANSVSDAAKREALRATSSLRNDLFGVDADDDKVFDDLNGDKVIDDKDYGVINNLRTDIKAVDKKYDGYDDQIRARASKLEEADKRIAARLAAVKSQFEELHGQELAALGKGNGVAVSAKFYAAARPATSPANGLPTIAAQSGTRVAWTKFEKEEDAIVAACKLVTDAAAATPSVALLPLVRKELGSHVVGNGWSQAVCPVAPPAAAPAPASAPAARL